MSSLLIRAEVGRCRFATQRDGIHDAAVHAKTHDAPRPLPVTD
jgi:hypothetical protein